ncbi:KGK domain-containing protein [Lyngbya sp. CCAP 1446/10]|uniref:KGK domain-containing protein n=2 Tax=Microcoleaceae TaxID=1892252 RepID=UPI0022389A4B|nr:KGK domain-containing protein [Lyngbya sp. CCAP 1446/10]
MISKNQPTKVNIQLTSLLKFTQRQIDMEESQIFLKEDDVLSTPATALMYQCTFKVGEFMTIMQSKLLEERLFTDGMDCELLSSGKAWTQGKIRLRLEFIPLAPEVEEQKALPAAPEESDSPQNNAAESFDETYQDEQIDVSDSTEISNDFAVSRYPDSNPHSRGMWS